MSEKFQFAAGAYKAFIMSADGQQQPISGIQTVEFKATEAQDQKPIRSLTLEPFEISFTATIDPEVWFNFLYPRSADILKLTNAGEVLIFAQFNNADGTPIAREWCFVREIHDAVKKYASEKGISLEAAVHELNRDAKGRA